MHGKEGQSGQGRREAARGVILSGMITNGTDTNTLQTGILASSGGSKELKAHPCNIRPLF